MDQDAQVDAMAQGLLPDAEFHAYFSVARLRAWMPPPGSEGIDPVLRLLCLPRREGALQVRTWALPGRRFDDVAARPGLLAETGTRAAQQGLQVLAVLQRSEAWMRGFTPEEYAARRGRLIETYADKEEMVIVAGQTLDGRCALGTARMLRRAGGRLAGYGDFRVQTEGVRMPLLDRFVRAYLLEKARAVGIAPS
jgi:hypothetical protein